MRRDQKFAALAVVLVTLSGCTKNGDRHESSDRSASPVPPAVLAFPKWEALGTAGLPTEAEAFEPETITAGDAGFVLYGQAKGLDLLYASKDGRRWAKTVPTGFPGNGEIADDGRAIYLLGGNDSQGNRAVWRYSGDGKWSSPATLESVRESQERSCAMSAGKLGVIVACRGSTTAEIHLWTSPDGKAFIHNTVQLTRTAIPGGDLLSALPLNAIPTPGGRIYLYAFMGVLRIVEAPGFPAGALDSIPADATVEFLALNGKNAVIYTLTYKKLMEGDPEYWENDEVGHNDSWTPTVWCVDGASAGQQPATLREAVIDPGQLPDLGVSPHHSPKGWARHDHGMLVAGKNTSPIDESGNGAIWLSGDGCTWAKDEVKANGFGDIDSLVSVATAKDTTVLVGGQRTAAGFLARIWRGKR